MHLFVYENAFMHEYLCGKKYFLQIEACHWSIQTKCVNKKLHLPDIATRRCLLLVSDKLITFTNAPSSGTRVNFINGSSRESEQEQFLLLNILMYEDQTTVCVKTHLFLFPVCFFFFFPFSLYIFLKMQGNNK